jgi:hypothetical protein
MSESLFINQSIREFTEAHPCEEGWKVYEFPGSAVRRLALHYLLDFVQSHCPERIKRRIAIKCVEEEELKSTPQAEKIEVPHKEIEQGQELRSDGWFGEIHLEWAGHRLHFKSILLKTAGGYTAVYHAATRSSSALCLFTEALERYGRSRQKEDARHITVINGQNIPLVPVDWSEIFLPDGLLDSIRCNIVGFFESRERYQALGIPYRRGLLLAGPPGCGKTLTIKALAYHTPVKFVTVLGKADIQDMDIQYAIDVAEKCAPAVVLFEDLDRILEAKDVSLSHFLNLLDGLKVLNGVLVIATCNEPEKLDPALLYRPSRFDRMWTFPLPAKKQRLGLLRRRGQDYFSDEAMQETAEKSHGFSMAYVQEIVVNALLESAHNGTTPTDSDLLRSLETLRSQKRDASRKGSTLEEYDSMGFALPNPVGIRAEREEA